jgi:predicted Zn-dependent peptidase
MKVTLVQYGSVPKVLVQAVVRAGRINEKPDEVWISDVVASMLKEGTKTRSAEQIAREMADMGGEIFASGGNDKSVFGGEVLSEFDARFVSLLADVIRNPRFAAEDLENIRSNELRSLSVSMAQAGNIGWKAFRETIYKGHPYANAFAEESDIKGYTLDGVKKFYGEQ